MKTTLTPENSPHEQLAALTRANKAYAAAYPGELSARQPVHTVYGGAHLFKAKTCVRAGEIALEAMATYANDPETFADALGLTNDKKIAERVYEQVLAKLKREPVEDYRIDFEDGYGVRPDAEEDGHAVSAATAAAEAYKIGAAPAFFGFRIKPLGEETRSRSIRTLDLFLTTFVGAMEGRLPEGFVVTLPKVTAPEQVEALVALLAALETALGLSSGSIKLELMVETPTSLFLPDGRAALPLLVALSKGRCRSVHLGAYDYTAACSITASHQHLRHPACDFARHIMMVSLAGTGVMLADGATNVMPIGPHRTSPGVALSEDLLADNRAKVLQAWRLAVENIRHALVNGFYQGWDLHPAQLPARYGTLFTFFGEGRELMAARLTAFLDKAAQATLLGNVFDDAATGQGLLNYFLRATACGAMTHEEAEALTGLGPAEFATRSFVRILEKNAR